MGTSGLLPTSSQTKIWLALNATPDIGERPDDQVPAGGYAYATGQKNLPGTGMTLKPKVDSLNVLRWPCRWSVGTHPIGHPCYGPIFACQPLGSTEGMG